MVIIEKRAKSGSKQAVRYCRSLGNYMRAAKRHPLANEYGIALATYMRREVGGKELPEKEQRVLAIGALVGGKPVGFEAAQLEVERRLAMRSRRSKKPARHLVGCYRAGEEPTADDCAEVARVLAEELGCGEGAILWALHGGTDNRHLHLLVLTLDADGQETPYGTRGQSHEAMQRAIARLEHAQQLTPEHGSRYVADENGVRRRGRRPPKAAMRAPIGTEILRWEEETGLESFTRYDQEVLAPVLDGHGRGRRRKPDAPTRARSCARRGAVASCRAATASTRSSCPTSTASSAGRS